MKFIVHKETGKVLTHYAAFAGTPEPHQEFIESDEIQVVESVDENGIAVTTYVPEFVK